MYSQTLCRRPRRSNMQPHRPRVQRPSSNRTALCHSSDKCYWSLYSHSRNFPNTNVAEEHRLCDIEAIWHWCGYFYRIRPCESSV
jgi:hypothetical protein